MFCVHIKYETIDIKSTYLTDSCRTDDETKVLIGVGSYDLEEYSKVIQYVSKQPAISDTQLNPTEVY